MDDGLVGVILSAGKGTRIDPFNTQYPKPLLPIGNRPILGHHMEMFRSLGIKKVFVVVGHLMDRIINHFGRGTADGLEITYVEQDQILGIAHACSRVEPYVRGPFVLALGDIFYLSASMPRLVERYRRGDVACVLAVKEETSPEPVRKNFTVELDARGLVTRVVEKPIQPRNLLKGCGVYVFGPEVFEAIHRTPRTALRDEYEITSSIQILVDEGHGVAAETVIDWDLNVTFPKDLLEGNLRYLQHRGLDNLVHESVLVPPDVRLRRCVIGAKVQIAPGSVLEDCVVLPDTVCPGDGPLHRTIVSGGFVIRC